MKREDIEDNTVQPLQGLLSRSKSQANRRNLTIQPYDRSTTHHRGDTQEGDAAWNRNACFLFTADQPVGSFRSGLTVPSAASRVPLSDCSGQRVHPHLEGQNGWVALAARPGNSNSGGLPFDAPDSFWFGRAAGHGLRLEH